MELWNDLTRTALLGTERGTRTWGAPDALGTVLSRLQAQETDAPLQLLRCSAVVGNFAQAGRLPARLASAPPSPAELDPRPVLGSAQHLRLMLQDHRLETLLPEWLALLAEHGLRAPEASIPTLLGLASRSPDLRRAIMAVIGSKGLWLAGQSSQWEPLLSVADRGRLDAALWETGTPDQRLAYLVQTRREDPAKAVELLAAVWSREGARERRKLLEVLSDSPGLADVAFLESALADRSKDVRGTAAGLLARIPGSTVRTRAVELLDGWLGFESKSGSGAALWAILSPSEQEEALTQSLATPSKGEPFARAFDRLGHLQHRWSPSFSSVVLQACLELFRDQTPDANYARYTILRQVAAHLDPGGYQIMEQGLESHLQATSPWQKIATEMLDTLRFRNDMIQAIESARTGSVRIESDQRGTP